MNLFRLKTCIKCRGDLAADNGDWLCLQCGTYYYTGLYQLHPKAGDGAKVSNSSVPEQPTQKGLGAVTAHMLPAAISPELVSPNRSTNLPAAML